WPSRRSSYRRGRRRSGRPRGSSASGPSARRDAEQAVQPVEQEGRGRREAAGDGRVVADLAGEGLPPGEGLAERGRVVHPVLVPGRPAVDEDVDVLARQVLVVGHDRDELALVVTE